LSNSIVTVEPAGTEISERLKAMFSALSYRVTAVPVSGDRVAVTVSVGAGVPPS